MEKRLNDKLLQLNKIDKNEREDLKKHLLNQSLNCGLCDDCLIRYEIIAEYENIFFKFIRNERRKSPLYKTAYEFVKKHYLSDSK